MKEIKVNLSKQEAESYGRLNYLRGRYEHMCSFAASHLNDFTTEQILKFKNIYLKSVIDEQKYINILSRHYCIDFVNDYILSEIKDFSLSNASMVFVLKEKELDK